jgi:hypothetical protein
MFRDDKQDGLGTVTWPGGSIYSGTFHEGRIAGKALLAWLGHFHAFNDWDAVHNLVGADQV